MTFEEWMRRVDAIISRKFGLHHSDLPDAPWRDWYDSEMTPKDAVKEYANEGWDDGMGMGELF